jgi:hypothetical protein
MKTTFSLIVIIFALIFAPSCKKKDTVNTPPPPPVDTLPVAAPELDLLRDSIYIY